MPLAIWSDAASFKESQIDNVGHVICINILNMSSVQLNNKYKGTRLIAFTNTNQQFSSSISSNDKQNCWLRHQNASKSLGIVLNELETLRNKGFSLRGKNFIPYIAYVMSDLPEMQRNFCVKHCPWCSEDMKSHKVVPLDHVKNDTSYQCKLVLLESNIMDEVIEFEDIQSQYNSKNANYACSFQLVQQLSFLIQFHSTGENAFKIKICKK